MIFDPDDPTITSYVFDELEPADKREFESRLEQSPELQEIVRRTRATIESLQASFDNSARLQLSDQHRAAVTSAISAGSTDSPISPVIEPNGTKKRAATVRRRAWSRDA